MYIAVAFNGNPDTEDTMANNRTQQRFDRSIREAVRVTRSAADRRPRRNALDGFVDDAPERPAGRMQLMRDPETDGTILAPWDSPEAVAWRSRKRVDPWADLRAALASREG